MLSNNPCTKSLLVRFLVRAAYLGYRFDPSSGSVQKATHLTLMFCVHVCVCVLSLSSFLSLSMSWGERDVLCLALFSLRNLLSVLSSLLYIRYNFSLAPFKVIFIQFYNNLVIIHKLDIVLFILFMLIYIAQFLGSVGP